MWDFTIPPLKGSASPLTIDSGTGSDTICNSPRIPLADIVCFATWAKPPSAAHGFQNASDRESSSMGITVQVNRTPFLGDSDPIAEKSSVRTAVKDHHKRAETSSSLILLLFSQPVYTPFIFYAHGI
ncbi:hypothetical protein PanWU01x14_327380 [Parasponia andersonii]|uniref:Uncharacterized protein n=1 Tax=Parasponia andersonii TaxID=3476 RepID=A0A2P5AJ47_PARAD|nr:hypothetical protein PanWU01x14_327380 [Parasponia andersonii]